MPLTNLFDRDGNQEPIDITVQGRGLVRRIAKQNPFRGAISNFLRADLALLSDAMIELPDSARRVADAASAAGIDIAVVEMAESTRTAEDAATACGCGVAQIVKSLVFIGVETGRPYLLLVSGVNRVDETGVATLLGEALKRPNGREVRNLTGYAIGGIPPIGHPVAMPAVIDEKLLEFDVVWAAAGTPHCVFSVNPNALRDAADARTYAF